MSVITAESAGLSILQRQQIVISLLKLFGDGLHALVALHHIVNLFRRKNVLIMFVPDFVCKLCHLTNLLLVCNLL